MAVSNSLSTLDPALKQYYKGGKLTKLAYDNHPFLAMVRKEKNLFGRNTPLVSWFANSAGMSSTFASAQANRSGELTATFLLTANKYYGNAAIDMLAYESASDSDASFLKSTTDIVDGVARGVGREVARQLYRAKGGVRGQIAAGGVSGAVLTLTNPADAINFKKGMRIVQSTAAGTGSLGSGDQLVTGVNVGAGTVTLAAGTNFTAADFLFLHGDHGLGINGVAGWCPTVAPTVGGGDSFLGVDRSADSLLYGQYIDCSTTGDTVSSAIGKMDVRIMQVGGKLTHVFVNPIDYELIRQNIGSQAVYDKSTSPDVASISFSTLRFAGCAGDVAIVSDPDCPQHDAFCAQLDSWVLKSAGAIPHGVASPQGDMVRTLDAADEAEVRLASYAELGCFAPGWNGRVKLPA
jgi:hypothetical protein